jgi:D-alanyl-D-alanine carboxypeptidase
VLRRRLLVLPVVALVLGGLVLASDPAGSWLRSSPAAAMASPSSGTASAGEPGASAPSGGTPSAALAVSPAPVSSAGPAPAPAAPGIAGGRSTVGPSGVPLTAGVPTRDLVLTAAKLDRAIAAWRVRYGSPGVSAAVLWPDGSLWTGAVGLADVAHGVPMTTSTAFAFASISKTFTGALILQLVDQGRLGLDEPVAPWLPGEGLDPRMTVRELLDHTSGLPDFFGTTGIDPALNSAKHRVWTVADALAYARKDRVTPNTSWRYSNTGYVYLGMLAEKVTGTPWATLVRQRLLTPYRLADAFVQGVEQPRSPLARGNVVTGSIGHWTAKPIGGVDPLTPFTSVVTAAGAAGAIAGTPTDLVHWAAALYGGEVLSPATLQAAVDDARRTARFHPTVPYGLGVQVVKYGPYLTWGHSGAFVGFRNQMRWLPEQRIAVSVLTDQSGVETGALVKQLIIIAAGLEPASSCTWCR